MTDATSAEYNARWAEIWAMKLRQLSDDMKMPPPGDFSAQEWDELSAAAEVMSVQLTEFKQKQLDARPD